MDSNKNQIERRLEGELSVGERGDENGGQRIVDFLVFIFVDLIVKAINSERLI